jgi:hypothetical protein
MRTGIERSETILAEGAAASGVRPAEYKKRLRRRYREMLDKVHHVQPDAIEEEAPLPVTPEQ